MTNIHIERVAPTELVKVIQLFSEQVYPVHPEEAHLHFAGHEQGQADTFLAWNAESLAGYLTIRWQSNYPQFRQQNIPLIHHLGVFPQFQRQGIASQLMDAAEQLISTRATQAGITVGLFDEYGPAQRLYAKRGYIPDGRGACQGQHPLKQGEAVTVDHDLILWLAKDL
ncbi:GNAT family N-acetyltransferase [Ktedonospora formicarum]|uniref:N-acetyltransferase n=1 Tax=Ktedonospora formicarum TaxID=2778364 RepID=A0A8J3I4I5_9CHLR|nr:GNAT family N-acetyltransferase [Ktedonospora formicarum]GHO46042.1 N-acetyltransferase [Ktedonospora formicarum]